MNDDKREKLKKTFSENLERIRKERGITRKELAEAVGVNETSFGAYCVGRNLPPIDKILIIAEILNCSIIDLTGDNPKAKVREQAIWERHWEESIRILNIAGFSVEENAPWITVVEQPKIEKSEGEIFFTPKRAVASIRNIAFPSLISNIIEIAVHRNSTFKDVLTELLFSKEESPFYKPNQHYKDMDK